MDMDVEFLVSTAPVISSRQPVIGVDGPAQGADLCFDHHATGEPVNLLVIPEEVPFPGTIATTMLDSDAILSAAVVLLRAQGEGAAVRLVLSNVEGPVLDSDPVTVWPILYEAAHYCDHLIPSGQYPEAERSGLGLHCWLKEKGFTLGEVRAWARGELKPDGKGGLRPVPSEATKAGVFRELTFALLTAIRQGVLPCDFSYLDRLAGMEEKTRQAVRQVEGCVTVLVPEGYIDPLALYRVVDTDLMLIIAEPLSSGAFRYSVGVHPRAYTRIDLRPIFARLIAREPGWGGRANAGGSPFETGSHIPLDDLLVLLNGDYSQE